LTKDKLTFLGRTEHKDRQVRLTEAFRPGNIGVMPWDEAAEVIAFAGTTKIASGPLSSVAAAAKRVIDGDASANVLVLNARTSEMVEVDFRGTLADVKARIAGQVTPILAQEARGPGRPKLGVVAREVTLLPRHWDWLAQQSGGASVALRRLVEEARRTHATADDLRMARDATYRFMATMAGDLPGFEEATRALYAREEFKFTSLIRVWPKDVSRHIETLAKGLFTPDT
jgi:hypothetical protein